MKQKILQSRGLSWALVLFGVFMMFVGINGGEAKVVFEKAIRICMECIGIG